MRKPPPHDSCHAAGAVWLGRGTTLLQRERTPALIGLAWLRGEFHRGCGAGFPPSPALCIRLRLLLVPSSPSKGNRKPQGAVLSRANSRWEGLSAGVFSTHGVRTGCRPGRLRRSVTAGGEYPPRNPETHSLRRTAGPAAHVIEYCCEAYQGPATSVNRYHNQFVEFPRSACGAAGHID